MATAVMMKDITVQTDFPVTIDAATSTVILLDEEDSEIGNNISMETQGDRRQIRTRSDLTLTDLPQLNTSNTLLRERLRLLQEEAELEEQVQEARLAALRAKKELLLSRIRHFQDRIPSGSPPLSIN